MLNLIFTVCNGRCGSATLARLINLNCVDALAEVEPPGLFYPNHWVFGNWLRNVQRRWIVTDEMMGRGSAFDWYAGNKHVELCNLSTSRLQRVGRLCNRSDKKHYFELSKFFIRTYFEATYKLRSDIGILFLHRDPLYNARSYVNRRKNFFLDNQSPNGKNVHISMNSDFLSKFQLYLWSWCETEIRFRRFVSQNNIKRYFELSSDDLFNHKKFLSMLDFFSIAHLGHSEFVNVSPINTNEEDGYGQTKIKQRDLDDFCAFVDMLPKHTLAEIPSFSGWVGKYISR